MKLYAGIDPGLTTGLAVANEEGEFQGFVSVHFDKIQDSLINWDTYWLQKPEVVIVEDYRLNPYTAKRVEATHSRIETVQVIGMVKIWCTSHDIECVIQDRDKKGVGYRYWGKKPLPKSNPMNHPYDAAAHLMFYMVNKKLIKVKL